MSLEEREDLTRQVMVSMKVGRVRAAEYVQMIDPLLADAERRGAEKALRAAAEQFGENQSAREGDVKEWLTNRADRIAQDRP